MSELRITTSPGYDFNRFSPWDHGANVARELQFVRYLWVISGAMILLGVALTLAGIVAVASPIALIAGVLLVWSGIVKIVVLRIWRSTLATTKTAPSGVRVSPSAIPEHP